MNTRKYSLIIAAISLVAVGTLWACTSEDTAALTAATSAPPASVNNTKTIENLQAAFNGESNAHFKYLAFAKKADEEGYMKVASLFRAAARAEEIHSVNHAQVIKKLGAEPTADIKTPEVKATAENLKAAIEGETYERDTMYPEFLAEAKKTGNKDAILTFNFAKSAEAEHAKLYSDALANLEQWKAGPATFFVCPKCGFTTADANLQKCPVDFTPKEKFEAIS
jgi:rubrerythrin